MLSYFLISDFRNVLSVVCFLLGNSPASEFYMPTFQNTLSVPSSWTGRYLPAYEDGARELPRRKHTTYHICVHMCNKNAVSLMLATHENGFYLSSGGTRVNQTIRSLLPAICVFWLKIHWVKCSSILCVCSYRLRLSFCVVFWLDRAVHECNLGITLSKHLTNIDWGRNFCSWQDLYFFLCSWYRHKVPYCHQGHSCSHEYTTLPCVFWIHLVYLNSQIPPSKNLQIKLEDLDGTCITDTSHNVSCTLFSTCKFHRYIAQCQLYPV